jgi:hypothetical protein
VLPAVRPGDEPLGEDISEQVSRRIKVVRIVHRRRKYAQACRLPEAAETIASGL